MADGRWQMADGRAPVVATTEAKDYRDNNDTKDRRLAPGGGRAGQMKNEEWWLVAGVARTSRACWGFIIGPAFF